MLGKEYWTFARSSLQNVSLLLIQKVRIIVIFTPAYRHEVKEAIAIENLGEKIIYICNFSTF